jgi:hypothetical protein
VIMSCAWTGAQTPTPNLTDAAAMPKPHSRH